MDKIRLGRTGLMVSRLGLGGGPIQRPSEDEAVRVVQHCLKLGITFIDTANYYTTSEERIGRAISGRREGIVLSTKSYERTAAGIKGHLQLSLKRLGVESIDLYQCHDVSDFYAYSRIMDANGPLPVLEEAKRKGEIRHIGISCHQIDVAKEAVKSDRFETVMFPFNCIVSEVAEELLPLARQHDVGFIAMKPLEGGRITNTALAIRYLLQFPDVLPIPGITRVTEIEEIVQLLNGPRQISAAEEEEIKRLREELGSVFCRRCNYCQPCNEEIPISSVLMFTGYVEKLPPERLFSGTIAEAMEKTAFCTQCGECEARCPYHLPIRDMIAERHDWYETQKKKYPDYV